MAGIAIPEQLRPYVAAVAKYHFWILAALVPLVLVPLVVVGGGGLRQRIAAERRTIESKLGQAKAVTAVADHPGESWQSAIDADTQAVSRETLDEWRRFWHSQSGLRRWPTSLGQEFLDNVARLKPGGSLDRQSLVRYQNAAKDLARTLPARMGVKDEMEASQDAAGGVIAGGSLPGSTPKGTAPPLAWNPANQRRIYESFVWPVAPTTTQVVLAQEELWVYGLLCDLVGGFVKARNATGAHDSPLTWVDELAVGFPAIEAPDQQVKRITMPKTAAAAPEVMPGMEMPPGALPGGMDGAARQPWHPRFRGGGGLPGPEGMPGTQPAGPTDDDFRSWIYIDFTGKPLHAADLAAAPNLRMVHLMPFVLRVVVDQRQIDRLLAAFAASSVPIDVRQVRVNPGAASAQQAGGLLPGGFGEPGGAPSGAAGLRPNDVIVELRGSVALATPPAPAPPPGAAP